MDTKELDDLYDGLKRIEELLKYAGLYGGKISAGDKTYSVEELKDIRASLKADIAVKISERELRVI